MINENNQLKIYGAGIISSNGETKHAINNNTSKMPFDVDTILETLYRTDIIQDKYFVIDSLSSYIPQFLKFKAV